MPSVTRPTELTWITPFGVSFLVFVDMPNHKSASSHFDVILHLLSVLNQEILAFWKVVADYVHMSQHCRRCDFEISIKRDLCRVEPPTLHSRPRVHVSWVGLLSVCTKRVTHDTVLTCSSTDPFPRCIIQIWNTPCMNQFMHHHPNRGWFAVTHSVHGRCHHVILKGHTSI